MTSRPDSRVETISPKIYRVPLDIIMLFIIVVVSHLVLYHHYQDWGKVH